MINFSQIIQKLKEVFSKMFKSKTIENILHVAPTISSEMQYKIELWEDMYKGKSPWLREPTFSDPTRIVSLGLPQMIAREKARTALLEFESEITTPMKEVEAPRESTTTTITDTYKQSNTEVNSTENEQQAGQKQQFNQFSAYNTAQFHPQATVKELVPKGPTERAEYLNKTYKKKLLNQLCRQIEYGIALGGLVIKPYVIAEKEEKVKHDENGLILTEEVDKYEIEFDFA